MYQRKTKDVYVAQAKWSQGRIWEDLADGEETMEKAEKRLNFYITHDKTRGTHYRVIKRRM